MNRNRIFCQKTPRKNYFKPNQKCINIKSTKPFLQSKSEKNHQVMYQFIDSRT